MGRLDGKVAFITGAARGQGRAHAVRFAQEGADIIAIDIVRQIDSVPYPLSTPEDFAETVRLVEAFDRRILATEADVRDYHAVSAALEAGVAELGGLDIVVANAGITSVSPAADLSEVMWHDMIDVNLTGVWYTAKAAIPHLRARGGGSMVLVSSVAGLHGGSNLAHYIAAKHGVVGVMRALTAELAADSIRVNTVNPTTVDTAMIQNQSLYELFAPDLPADARTRDNLAGRFQTLNALPIPWVDAADIANAVLWLVSDEARYVTGIAMPVDAGQLQK